MRFSRKKVSAIDRRLKVLHKEMARVSRDLRAVSRSGLVTAVSQQQHRSLSAGNKERVAPWPEPMSDIAGGTSSESLEGDLFAHTAKAEWESTPPPRDYFPRPSAKIEKKSLSSLNTEPDEPLSRREKFANYFMAGHFQNLRPLRQESRILRNKAILMIILALLALLWLFYFL